MILNGNHNHSETELLDGDDLRMIMITIMIIILNDVGLLIC